MKRATVDDAATIASIINHPTVRPFVGPGEEDVDPSDLLSDDKNILLFEEGGGQLFHWRGPGIYEVHTFCLVRGKDAMRLVREATRMIFQEYAAEKLWGVVSVENRPARWFFRQVGYQSLGTLDMGPTYAEGGDCELFEMKGL